MNIKPLATALLLSVSSTIMVGCAIDGHERTAGAVIDDSAITTKVKAELLAAKDVNSLDIKVETFNGTVQLSGFVDSQFQIDKAVQITSGVSGVKTVKNDLVHKPR